MAMKLTKADDYAIRAMIYLACLPEDRVAMRAEIADRQGIPGSFMAKILRLLVRARLLKSARGVNGGFRLARPASEINLLQVIEAVEGPLHLATCSTDASDCEWSRNCPASTVLADVQSAVGRILGEATLEALVSTPRRRKNVDRPVPLSVVRAC